MKNKFILLLSLLVVVQMSVFSGSFKLKDLEKFDMIFDYRLVGYYKNNADMDDKKGDHIDYFQQNIKLGFQGNVTEKAFVKLILEYENNWGDEDKGNRTVSESSSTKVQYGYVQFKKLLSDKINVTLGRQDYYLAQGFILNDDCDGYDGVKINLDYGKLKFDLVYFKFSDSTENRDDTSTVKDSKTFGLIGFYNLNKNVNLIGFALQERDGGNADAEKNFLGLRCEGSALNFDYTGQYVYQLGEDNLNKDYDASMIYLSLAYNFDVKCKLKLYGDYYEATGNDAGSNDNEDFGTSRGYGYLNDGPSYDGAIDAFQLATDNYVMSNVRSYGLGFSFEPLKKVCIKSKYYFLKQEKNGNKYGDVIDLGFSYEVDNHNTVTGSISMFSADDDYKVDADESWFGTLYYNFSF